MNTLSTITVMPETKETLALYTKNLKSEILAGYENPLRIAKLLKAMEETIKSLREDKDVREIILSEAMKYSEKTIEAFGAEFQTKETGVKYDYSVCDDDEWKDLQEQQTRLAAKIKARETFLKSIKGDVYDGNGVKLNPPVKTSTTLVTVILK
jgi:hypothetical protein